MPSVTLLPCLRHPLCMALVLEHAQMTREGLSGPDKVLSKYPFAAHFCAGMFAESIRCVGASGRGALGASWRVLLPHPPATDPVVLKEEL